MTSEFNEGVEIKTQYNIIPRGMRIEQRTICIGCEYRICKMQYRIAREEAGKKGGFVRDYLLGFYMQPIPSCERGNCLLDKLVLFRNAKK